MTAGWVRRPGVWGPPLANAAVVGALVLAAMWDPQRVRTPLLVAAMALSLPAMVPGLPVLYVAGGWAWHLTAADAGGPSWSGDGDLRGGDGGHRRGERLVLVERCPLRSDEPARTPSSRACGRSRRRACTERSGLKQRG